MTYQENDFKDLKLQQEGSVLTIKLDRPDSRNAFSLEMIHSLCDILEVADQDRNIKVFVLTGEGKSFCAGGDIKEMDQKRGMFAGEPNELRMRYHYGIQQIPRIIDRLNTPIIAMINGAAIGAGLDLACMCDLRVANEEAKFGETFNRLGLVPGDGGTFFLPRIVGEAKAKEMFFTGKIYDAQEALKMNLVHQVHRPEQLEAKTYELVKSILKNAPIALSMTKRAIHQARSVSLENHLELLSALQSITQRTRDHESAVRGLLDRKDVEFKSF